MTGRGAPVGVTVVRVLSFLAGHVFLLIGVAALIAAVAGYEDVVIGVVSVLIGLAFIIFGIGCRKGWGGVWMLGVIMSAMGTMLAIFTWWRADFGWDRILSAGIMIIINVLILLYLQTYKVKAWFSGH